MVAVMSKSHFVKACVARHDGAFMVTFRDGSLDRAAVCTEKLEPGEAFTIREGAGSYPVATPARVRQS